MYQSPDIQHWTRKITWLIVQGLFFSFWFQLFKGGRREKNINRKSKISGFFWFLPEISHQDYSLTLSQFVLVGDNWESYRALYYVYSEVAYRRLLFLFSFCLFFLFFSLFFSSFCLKIKLYHFDPSMFFIKKCSGHVVQHIRTHKYLLLGDPKWVLM